MAGVRGARGGGRLGLEEATAFPTGPGPDQVIPSGEGGEGGRLGLRGPGRRAPESGWAAERRHASSGAQAAHL